MSAAKPSNQKTSETLTSSPEEGRRAGMSDVAKKANVSIGTVSNFLNYPDRVSDKLKFKIQSAIESLGYVRAQKRKTPDRQLSTPIIGFVMADIENSLYTSVFEGIQEICDTNDMEVVAVNSLSYKDRQTELVHMFCQMNLAGILLSSVSDSQDDVAFARAAGIPVVMIDHLNPLLMNDHCSVLKNDEAAGELAARELIRTGCTHLTYVAHSFNDFQAIKNRKRGVLNVLDDFPEIILDIIDSGGIMTEDGYDVGRHILALPQNDRPDGIIAGTDFLATGLLMAFAEDSSVQVPNDISVIGTEGDKMESVAPIPLTVVSSPGVDMGRQATLQLIDEITNPSGHIHSTQLLMPVLERRASSRK